jgi:hypothetical protein
VRLSELSAVLAAHGQRFSLDPPADPTVGQCLLELSFDTDFDYSMESVLMTHAEAAMPFCVRQYRVRAGSEIVAESQDNHQTRKSHSFPDGSFGAAVPVPELNSPQLETRPTIRHDGREIILTSQRPGGFGGADLWVAVRETASDPWSTPENLGPTVNTSFAEGTPGISSDGTLLFLHSDRPGTLGDDDLYVSVRTRKGRER